MNQSRLLKSGAKKQKESEDKKSKKGQKRKEKEEEVEEEEEEDYNGIDKKVFEYMKNVTVVKGGSGVDPAFILSPFAQEVKLARETIFPKLSKIATNKLALLIATNASRYPCTRGNASGTKKEKEDAQYYADWLASTDDWQASGQSNYNPEKMLGEADVLISKERGFLVSETLDKLLADTEFKPQFNSWKFWASVFYYKIMDIMKTNKSILRFSPFAFVGKTYKEVARSFNMRKLFIESEPEKYDEKWANMMFAAKLPPISACRWASYSVKDGIFEERSKLDHQTLLLLYHDLEITMDGSLYSFKFNLAVGPEWQKEIAKEVGPQISKFHGALHQYVKQSSGIEKQISNRTAQKDKGANESYWKSARELKEEMLGGKEK